MDPRIRIQPKCHGSGTLIYSINKEDPIYQNHVVYDDDPPDGDGMVGVGERVEQALLPLQAVEHLLANFCTRLEKNYW
jgi:hypothetical protein